MAALARGVTQINAAVARRVLLCYDVLPPLFATAPGQALLHQPRADSLFILLFVHLFYFDLSIIDMTCSHYRVEAETMRIDALFSAGHASSACLILLLAFIQSSVIIWRHNRCTINWLPERICIESPSALIMTSEFGVRNTTSVPYTGPVSVTK